MMNVFNLFKKNKEEPLYDIFALHNKFFKEEISRQEYTDRLEQALISALYPKDVLTFFNEHKMNILSLDKGNKPNCNLSQLILAAEATGKAAKCALVIGDMVKERAAQKDPKAENFSKRFANIEVVPSSEWLKVYEATPDEELPESMQNVEKAWRSLCVYSTSLALSVPLIANKYADMVRGHARYECER